jgi:transcriptional regulator with XRE-family HTH domain
MDVKEIIRLRVTADQRPEISEAFRRARMSMGLSQQELADRLNGDQGTVSRWERGVDSPPVSALVALMGMLPAKDRGWWQERLDTEREEGKTLDAELLACVIEAVEAAANKAGVVLPRLKYAAILARVYDSWRETGQRDRTIVEEMVSRASSPSNRKVRTT